tara:strand:- start:1533 stop:1949 length:417 start_codon:yes stop_codon:yes gene_type:complete
MSEWKFYIVANGNYTYAGVSPDPVRRLRQHNGEIKGGAKYTTSKGNGWEHICLISGFKDKIQAMQFEWAVKHVPPRNSGGLRMRMNKVYAVLKKERWTSNAPLSREIPLIIDWKIEPIINDILPEYIQINKSIYKLEE